MDVESCIGRMNYSETLAGYDDGGNDGLECGETATLDGFDARVLALQTFFNELDQISVGHVQRFLGELGSRFQGNDPYMQYSRIPSSRAR